MTTTVKTVKDLLLLPKVKIEGVPDGEMMPNEFKGASGVYQITAEGVFFERDVQNGSGSGSTSTQICGLIRPIYFTTNKTDGSQGLVVGFIDRKGIRKDLSLSYAEIGRGGSTLVSKLASCGLYFPDVKTQGGAASVGSYLMAYPAEDLPTVQTVDSVGWIPDGTYTSFALSPTKAVTAPGGSYAVLSSDVKICPAIAQQGTLEEWKKNVEEIAKHSILMRFGLCVTFAAPLSPMVDNTNRIFHFYGDSSAGKSSILNIMASVFGGKDFKQTWLASANGIEGLAAQYNCLPLCLDEAKEADATAFERVAYVIGNGRGKVRSYKSGDARKAKTWSTYGASAGEFSFPETCRNVGRKSKIDPGEGVRIIDVPLKEGNPFGVFDSFDSPEAEDWNLRHAFVMEHCDKFKYYGTAGVAYLEKLVQTIQDTITAKAQNPSLKSFQEQLEEDITAFSDSCVNAHKADGKLGGSHANKKLRILHAFAVVAAAGELAIKFGILPFEPGDASKASTFAFEAWLGSASNPSNEEEDSVAILLSAPQTRKSTFRLFKENGGICGESRTAGAAGTLILEPNEVVPLVLVMTGEQFKTLLLDQGIKATPKDLIEQLCSAGRLYSNCDNEGYKHWFKPSTSKSAFGFCRSNRFRAVIVDDDLVEDLKKNPNASKVAELLNKRARSC